MTRTRTRPAFEILEEDFGITDIDSREGDILRAGMRAHHEVLLDALAALEGAQTRSNRPGQLKAAIRDVAEALAEIES